MHKPKSIQENEMHKILQDFKIQMDRLISARRTDLVLIKKENLPYSRFCHPSRPQNEGGKKLKRENKTKIVSDFYLRKNNHFSKNATPRSIMILSQGVAEIAPTF